MAESRGWCIIFPEVYFQKYVQRGREAQRISWSGNEDREMKKDISHCILQQYGNPNPFVLYRMYHKN